MPNYTLDLIAVSSIKDDISPLVGAKDVWRVTSDGSLVAYCADKALADRIAGNNQAVRTRLECCLSIHPPNRPWPCAWE